MSRARKYILGSLAALAIVFFAAAVFLLNSQTVLRHVFYRFAPAGLAVQSVKGRLAGPIMLKGVSYSLKGTSVRIGSIKMDWRLAELLSLNLHITRLDMANMVLEVSKKPAKPPPPARPLPQLRLPSFFSVQLGRVTAENVEYVSAASKGSKPFVISRLGLNALMRGSTLYIRGLQIEGPLPAGSQKTGPLPPRSNVTGQVHTPGYSVAVQGKLNPQDGYPLSLKMQWTFTPGARPPVSGTGALSGTLGKLHILQAINPPYNMNADLTVYGLLAQKQKGPGGETKTPEWDGKISWHDLRLPHGLLQKQKQGSGKTAALSSKGDPAVAISGKPAVISSGEIFTQGNPSAYSLSIDAAFLLEQGKKRKNLPQSRITLEGEGNTKGLSIRKLGGIILGGRLHGSGNIAWKPEMSWALVMGVKGLAPGQVSPRWKGTVDLELKTNGSIAGVKRNIALDILSVQGRLRGYPVSGSGRFLMKDRNIFIPGLEVRFGQTLLAAAGSISSGVTASGRPARRWDFSWRMNSKNLGEFLPDAGGSLSASGTLKGQGKKPVVSARITGRGTAYKTYRMRTLSAAMRIDLSGRTASSIALGMTGLQAGKRKVRMLRMSAAGKLPSHEITILARGRKTALAMALKGGYKESKLKGGGMWIGKLTRMNVSETGYGTWRLTRPAPVRLSRAAALLDVCLAKGPADICLKADWSKPAGADILFAASRVPLGLFQPMMPRGMLATGTLDGKARIFYAPQKAFTGNADIRLTNGALAFDLKGKSVRRSFSEATITLASTKQTVLVNLKMPFVEGGGINCRVAVLISKGQHINGATVNLSVASIPVGLFAPFMPPGLLVTGTLGGNAGISYGIAADKGAAGGEKVSAGEGGIKGNADIRLTNGAFDYSLAGKKMRLSFRESSLKMESKSETVAGTGRPVITASFVMPFVEGGGINGQFTILPPLKGGKTPVKGQPPVKTKGPLLIGIKGGVHMDIPNLGIMAAVLPSVKNVRGIFRADLGVSGTLPHPDISGRLALDKVQATVPTLGITTGASMTAVSAGNNRFHIEGRLTSGGGYIDIKGDVANAAAKNQKTGASTPAKAWALALGIKGENFQVVKTPEAQAAASPDLTVAMQDKEATVRGVVTIPKASIKPVEVSGAIRPSPDVVVVSEKGKPVSVAAWKVHADVKVVLGKDISFKGFGLKSVMTGALTVHEEPGKIATGQGELVIVKGTYKAYGQDLVIENGKLLYSGQPINDPGLAIKAVRTINPRTANEVVAGINVSGTLRQPKIDLFSEPPMDQTDALSYLILGKPVNSASGSQGNLLYGAATSLGLAGGALIANKIGALFGIKASVEKTPPKTATGQEQATLFLGRYLSPRLYVAYGVGIFEPENVFRVRYRITRDWLIQTESGTETGGDVLYKLQWE